MTPHTASPAVAPLRDQRLAPDLPPELASALLACGIGERWFAVRAFAPVMESPKAARDFTRATLRSWSLDELSADAEVIVSELVTNAWRHGLQCGPDGVGPDDDEAGSRYDPIELFFWQARGFLFATVTDPSPQPPVLTAAGPCAEAGRGLHVIEALAASWGWGRLDVYRKAVWAALPAPAPDTAL